jgi:hypothetical protein
MHRASTIGRELRRGAGLACVLMAGALGGTAAAEEPITAVFKAREVDFTYRSSNTYLPCHEIQGRVARILSAVGARQDMEVRVHGCEDFLLQGGGTYRSRDQFDRPSDPFESSRDPFERANDPFDRSTDRFAYRRSEREQMAHISVRLMTPVEVTPKVLEEIQKDKSRRELISRVTGNPMAAMNDPVVFPAQRQTVTLSRQTLKLDAADCELLEDMSRGVFRKLDVRVVRGAPNCGGSRIPPQITVEALLPVVASTQVPGAQQLPATGQAPSDPGTTSAPPAESQTREPEQR